MLHSLIRNKLVYGSLLALIWLLIILVPRVAHIYHHGYRRTLSHEDDAPLTRDVEEKPDQRFAKNPEEETDDGHVFAGEISQGKLCLDTLSGRYGSKIGLFKCTGAGGNQFWFIKNNNVLQNRNFCLEAQVAAGSVEVLLEKCRGGLGQSWEHIDQALKLSGSDFCLTSNKKRQVAVEQCDPRNKLQKWHAKGHSGV